MASLGFVLLFLHGASLAAEPEIKPVAQSATFDGMRQV
jgi:hypothetical protein